MSIDVDNDDYLIWKEFKNYRPRVVIIEVNSYLSPDIEKIPKKGYRGRPLKSGASIYSTVKLAKSKGYELALHTGNCIFVLREYCQELNIDPINWQELFDASWINMPDQDFNGAFRRVVGRPYRWVKNRYKNYQDRVSGT